MFELYCHVCDRDHLVGPRAILSLHNTTEGPVAYVRCPLGHHLVRSFRDGRHAPTTGRAGAGCTAAA